MITTPTPKYLYRMYAWGGFFNEEHKSIHQFADGEYIFNTKEARQKQIDAMEKCSKEMNAHVLCIALTEGFHVHDFVTFHRVCEYKGKRVYTATKIETSPYEYSDAEYFIEWKWYPGFNDYPFGEDFDYEDPEFKVLQEWITGAFTFKRQS